MSWHDDQSWEKAWWNNCTNTFFEELKQIHYVKRMGLKAEQTPDGKYPVFDFKGKSVIDLGGGSVSLLLKCINVRNPVVVDPLDYPQWTMDRYKTAGIDFVQMKAEDIKLTGFDEVLIYNLLQHTENPEKIIKNARKIAKVIRIFEWIDHGVMPGHPQDLKEDKLNEWLGAKGKVERIIIGSMDCGMSYSGVFKT